VSDRRHRRSNEPCLSGCNPQPLGLVFGHTHGRSPAWRSSAPTIAPRVSATFSRRRGLRRLLGEDSLERLHFAPIVRWRESASTGGSIRSMPSVHCSASRAALPHRPMRSFTPVPGSTLHLGGVGKNRIGKQRTSTCTLPLSVQPNSASACLNAKMRAFPRGSFSSSPMSTPMRRTRPGCARTASGHAAAPASLTMNSRRRSAISRAETSGSLPWT
jgi:hypothetical protein